MKGRGREDDMGEVQRMREMHNERKKKKWGRSRREKMHRKTRTERRRSRIITLFLYRS